MSHRAALLLALLSTTACAASSGDVPLTVDEDSVGAVPDLAIGSSARTTGDLNLRRSGLTSGRIIDVLPRGTVVEILGRSGSWYSVDTGSETGWVSGRYLEAVASEAPDASATEAPDSGASTARCDPWLTSSAFTCSPDGLTRGQCADGAPVLEPCARGCLRTAVGDHVCLDEAGSDSVRCPGSWGTTKASDGDYYLTAFGCWVDAAGAIHTDSGDNCIPSCLDEARAAGLCLPGDSGPRCEERVTWYTADGGRFGCLARLRVTNPANGRAVVAVALDFGPGCRVERSAGRAVLDASGRVNRYLFGTDNGWSDRAGVHVVEVDPSTPLGPVN